ncbi:hypothetical protein SAMN02745866_01224 [Alteromonadaceae bacterium Bs31]|nr:hypothetical protein SAMN02745866_01224 [Alteromonadaceae bacterium Bs31]
MKKLIFLIWILPVLVCSNAFSAEPGKQGSIQITDLLKAFSKNSGLKVVASKELKGEAIYTGFTLDELNYDLLLTILKLNGFTAFKNEKYVEVVPQHRARVYASEILDEDVVYPEDQYLIATIKVENLCVSSLMPVLMPLVYRYSFISTQYESNSIVIVDYFSHIKAIKALVEDLDSTSEKQKKCEKFEMRPRAPLKVAPKTGK